MKMYIRNLSLDEFDSSVENIYIEKIENKSYETKPHIHDCFQIIFCLHGSIIHHLPDTSARMLRGDVAIIPPNTEHYLSVNEQKNKYYNIAFRQEEIAKKFPNIKTVNDFLKSLTDTKTILPRLTLRYEDIYLLESTIGKMRIEYEERRNQREEVIAVCLLNLLTIISRQYIEQGKDYMSETDRKIKHLNHCIFYIDSHFDSPITLEQIAKMSTMSKSTFCSMFKEATGMTFSDYLNKKRIERIQSTIRNGASISTAAYGNGYNDLSTFYRNFVKHTGMTPSEFKKQIKTDRP